MVACRRLPGTPATGSVGHDEAQTLLAGMNGSPPASSGGRSWRPPPRTVRGRAVARADPVACSSAGSDERATHGAMAVVIAGEWVQNPARMEADLERPVRGGGSAARTRWWR